MRRESGFSLIELMIAVTIGLVILSGMVGIFVASSQSHNELEKASRQIESGRYAAEMIREDAEHAAFYGDYAILPTTGIVWQTPDPCTTTLSEMLFDAATVKLATGLFGYENGAGLSTNCSAVLANRKPLTDVLVVRRVSTAPTAVAALQNGEYYLQISDCADTPAEDAFVLGNRPASFTLHAVRPAGGPPASCLTGDLNAPRKYMVHIYYVAVCNDCTGAGDGIPTLKMAELTKGAAACSSDPLVSCGSFTLRPIAEGIENLQIEYGADTTVGGDGIPDIYQTAGSVAAWDSIVAVKVFVLARNTETTPGYSSSKVYLLNSSGNPATGVGPFTDAFKRHVYTITARANNISGRRQQ